MLSLITGGTGDGKTLRAIYELKTAIESNRKANALGEGAKGYEPLREFRTNIKGCRIPGVIPSLDKDWRNYPDGSYLVYDEAHQQGWFRTTGKPGLSDDPVITHLDEHRHRGFDITFITQFPTKIHNEVRQLVKRHTHLHRSLAMERTMLWEWSRCINNPYDEESVTKMEGEIWEFDPSLYNLYDSASLHTHKFVWPKKLKNALITVPIVVGILFSLYWFLVRPLGQRDEPAQAVAASAASAPASLRGSPSPPSQFAVDQVKVEPMFRGCALLEFPEDGKSISCRCWTSEGQQMVLTFDRCKAIALGPMPLDFSDAASRPTVARASTAGQFPGSDLFQQLQKQQALPALPPGGSSAGRPHIGDNYSAIAGGAP